MKTRCISCNVKFKKLVWLCRVKSVSYCLSHVELLVSAMELVNIIHAGVTISEEY